MTISRIYYPRELQPGERCLLTGEDRQYVLSVLRMKRGDRLLLFDGAGREYEADILGYDGKAVTLTVVKKKTIRDEGVNITLAQSLPKAKKMEFIIEKACELGANRIIPFFSATSVPRLTPEKALAKQARWQKVASEAARKSHSPVIPEVANILDLEKALRSAGEDAVKIIFWEEEKGRNLKQFLRRKGNETGKDFFLVVGPEGGFAAAEVELAEGLGFTSISLGRQILKVETASLAILSMIQYEKGVFGQTGEEGENK